MGALDIKIIIVTVLLIALLSGCDEYSTKAIVADYVTGSKYEIIKVDGGPVERVKHGFVVTKVPQVLLEQGPHLLLLKIHKENSDKNGHVTELNVTVEKGKRYHFVTKKDIVCLVEEKINE